MVRKDINIFEKVNTFVLCKGGMLSAWMRMKYPHIVTGSIAASAPIFQNYVGCDSFSFATTSTFERANAQCPHIIRRSWDALNLIANSTNGLEKLTEIFALCTPLDSIGTLIGYLIDIYGSLAMANYPYSATLFLPLPAWPVNVFCDTIVNSYNSKTVRNFSILLVIQLCTKV